MAEEEEDKTKRTVISNTETIPLKRIGTSNMFRVPAYWKKSFRELIGDSVFEAHIERDEYGGIYIVFRKVRNDEVLMEEKKREVGKK